MKTSKPVEHSKAEDALKYFERLHEAFCKCVMGFYMINPHLVSSLLWTELRIVGQTYKAAFSKAKNNPSEVYEIFQELLANRFYKITRKTNRLYMYSLDPINEFYVSIARELAKLFPEKESTNALLLPSINKDHIHNQGVSLKDVSLGGLILSDDDSRFIPVDWVLQIYAHYNNWISDYDQEGNPILLTQSEQSRVLCHSQETKKLYEIINVPHADQQALDTFLQGLQSGSHPAYGDQTGTGTDKIPGANATMAFVELQAYTETLSEDRKKIFLAIKLQESPEPFTPFTTIGEMLAFSSALSNKTGEICTGQTLMLVKAYRSQQTSYSKALKALQKVVEDQDLPTHQVGNIYPDTTHLLVARLYGNKDFSMNRDDLIYLKTWMQTFLTQPSVSGETQKEILLVADVLMQHVIHFSQNEAEKQSNFLLTNRFFSTLTRKMESEILTTKLPDIRNFLGRFLGLLGQDNKVIPELSKDAFKSAIKKITQQSISAAFIAALADLYLLVRPERAAEAQARLRYQPKFFAFHSSEVKLLSAQYVKKVFFTIASNETKLLSLESWLRANKESTDSIKNIRKALEEGGLGELFKAGKALLPNFDWEKMLEDVPAPAEISKISKTEENSPKSETSLNL